METSKQPLVSFIIPYYNSGETIQETIDSIFNQSYPHFDIWLINDGSTDQLSIDKLKEFEGNDKIHLLHQENAGPSVARNKAIQLSSAEFIVPLDADDLVVTTAISECVHRATSKVREEPTTRMRKCTCSIFENFHGDCPTRSQNSQSSKPNSLKYSS